MMMTKMEFAETIKNSILEYLPEHISAGREAKVVTVLKHNDQELVGISIMGDGDVVSGPNCYLEEAYQDYLEFGDLDGILRDVAKFFEFNWNEVLPNIPTDLEFEKVKDKIIFTVIDKERNEKRLADSPHHFDESGLAFIYSIVIEEGCRAVINNELARSEKYDAEKLYEIAKYNTQKMYTPTLEAISETLKRLADESAVVDNLLTSEDPAADDIMYVLSNDKCFFGSNALFVDGVKEKISEVLGGSYYALPSSIHEWMILPDKGGYENAALQKMLIEGNSLVEPQEILSDDVFRYDSETKTLAKVAA